jgi:hypothetical protein
VPFSKRWFWNISLSLLFKKAGVLDILPYLIYLYIGYAEILQDLYLFFLGIKGFTYPTFA